MCSLRYSYANFVVNILYQAYVLELLTYVKIVVKVHDWSILGSLYFEAPC